MEYALITGASRGLGKAIAERLAKEGYAVIVNYNNSEKAARETVENIEAAGGKAELMKLDVKEGSQVDAAIEAWEAAHPEDYIAVLVNNAGVREDSLLVFMQDEQWDKVMETTLGGFFYLTRRVVKNMMTHRNGRIVNI